MRGLRLVAFAVPMTALIAVGLMIRPEMTSAQILTPNQEFEKQYRPPLSLQSGILTWRMDTASGNSDWYVTGMPAGDLLDANTGVRAYMRSGNEVSPVITSREGDYFIERTPATDATRLQMNDDLGSGSGSVSGATQSASEASGTADGANGSN